VGGKRAKQEGSMEGLWSWKNKRLEVGFEGVQRRFPTGGEFFFCAERWKTEKKA